jgi:hypothetical protein
VIITTATATVQAPSDPKLIMNTECITQWWYLPVYTIIGWHLGDTKQCVMPMHVIDWTDNPSEFIPNVHNYLGVTVLHTVGVT